MVKKIRKQDPYVEREAQKYEHPIVSREFILEFIANRKRPVTQQQLVKAFALETPAQTEALRRRLLAMVRDGQLLQNRRGAFGLIDKMELIKGYVVGHKDGFGFVVPENDEGDLFLNARQMRRVFPDDEVLVRVSAVDSRGRREGTIVDVLVRHTHEIVGRVVMESGVAFIQPSNQRIAQDILIPLDKLNDATNGQMVVAHILEQPTLTTRAVGKVVEILGDHMAPGMEIDIAIRNHELPNEWPEKVLKETKAFYSATTEDALKGRLDLRKKPFVTIDGEDAKDFDDAVYGVPHPEGGWTLYVAIADVGHYVKPRSELDKEALNRGNSVYFPGRVLPMLPEVLSNDLCSLKENVDRLTLVCEMTISATGKIKRYAFHEAVIRSEARLTYNQVYSMIVGKDKLLQKKYKKLLNSLTILFDIYKVLYKERQKRGAIDFDLPEPKIIFGANRKIERITVQKRNDAHKLIEECMLCANICAARFLLKNESPALYRVHDGPSPEKLADLRKFLGELGLTLPGGEIPVPRDYAKLLKIISDRPDARLIQTVLLRSLSQAIYHPENNGHFGLAFDGYTHFTSPIRRYPDLLVHRAIRRVLQKNIPKEDVSSVFEKYGEHCSMTERRADEATREATDWLKCEYMVDKVGETFGGIISSVTSFGLFVELSDIYIEGLIHISMLKNDYYHFDPVKHALMGERTGQCYRLGDVVTIKVVRVDLDQRKMDFMLLDDFAAIHKPKVKTKTKTKRKKPKKK